MGVQNRNRSPREVNYNLGDAQNLTSQNPNSPALFSPGLSGRLEEMTFGGLFLAGNSMPSFQICYISLTLGVPSILSLSTDHVKKIMNDADRE